MNEGTGLLGVVNLSDLEPLAAARLEPLAFAYYAGGAADECTLRDNESAWGRRRFRPRVLVDVSVVDPSTTVLGSAVSLPIGVAPTALHGLGHPDGEPATARGAADAGALFTLSTLSSRPMEDLAAVEGPRWFQLYAHRDRGIITDLVARAAATGHRAIVLTVDLPVLGRREREVRAGFEWESGTRFANLAAYGAEEEPVVDSIASDLTWDDVTWLRGLSDLPVVVKGVLTAEDGVLAVEHGAAGVWVSNHGGRQLDRTPATADVLEEVAQAVAATAEVYVDGGVRRGADAVVALALGATAVFVGRPVLYALALGGAAGVTAAFDVVRAELVNTMALLGVTSVDQIGRAHLR